MFETTKQYIYISQLMVTFGSSIPRFHQDFLGSLAIFPIVSMVKSHNSGLADSAQRSATKTRLVTRALTWRQG